MSVGAGGDLAHETIVHPDAVVAGGVRIVGVHVQQHDSLGRSLAALAPRRLHPDEPALVEGDEPVKACHPRRAVLSELGVPDPVALLEPEAVDRTVADRAQAVRRSGLRELAPQRSVLWSAHPDLIADLTGEADAA